MSGPGEPSRRGTCGTEPVERTRSGSSGVRCPPTDSAGAIPGIPSGFDAPSSTSTNEGASSCEPAQRRSGSAQWSADHAMLHARARRPRGGGRGCSWRRVPPASLAARRSADRSTTECGIRNPRQRFEARRARPPVARRLSARGSLSSQSWRRRFPQSFWLRATRSISRTPGAWSSAWRYGAQVVDRKLAGRLTATLRAVLHMPPRAKEPGPVGVEQDHEGLGKGSSSIPK